MSSRRPRRAPSWLGTLIIAAAVVITCLRAAEALRRAVAGPAPSGAAASTGGSARP